MNSASAKSELRTAGRDRLKSLSAAEWVAGSRTLCGHLLASALWKRSNTVLLFAPIAREPDIMPAFAAALADGKRIALPRYREASSDYEAALIRGLADLTPPGAFGVREPRPECAGVELLQLDLALVPGIAFDPLGRRLGRGKGFYDRLLAGMTAVKCGVGFDCQLIDEVPAEPHDVTLNCILTPTRWLPREPEPRL